jgi:type VI protein secretion system component VasK
MRKMARRTLLSYLLAAQLVHHLLGLLGVLVLHVAHRLHLLLGDDVFGLPQNPRALLLQDLLHLGVAVVLLLLLYQRRHRVGFPQLCQAARFGLIGLLAQHFDSVCARIVGIPSLRWT